MLNFASPFLAEVAVTLLIALKQNLRAVRRPARIEFVALDGGQGVLVAAVCVHDIDVAVAVTFGDERDLLSIGRPIAAAFVGGGMGHVFDVAAIYVAGVQLEDGVFVAIGLEEDLLPIGRPVGRPAVRGLEGHDGAQIAAVHTHGVDRKSVV